MIIRVKSVRTASVNAVAAHEKYKGDLIIIDFGTATTYCAVQGNGDYMAVLLRQV